MMENIVSQKIPWGKSGWLEFDLPQGWQMVGSYKPAELAPLPDVAAALDAALANPTGCPPLTQTAAGKCKIVIVVDDVSRPTPAHLLMGSILSHLQKAGADMGNVTVVAAPGLHRVMEYEDMVNKVGKEVLERISWLSHDSRDESSLTDLGRTDRGTPVLINRTVAEADFRVLVGTIEPHPHAGFGGGLKNILPGVAGVESIARNHAICADPKYFFLLGSDPDSNPMRSDLEQAAGLLKGETFIVNTVLNAAMQVVGITAGHPVKAHREGAKLARQVFGVSIPGQADVVITDSFPMDIDLRQGVKAAANVLYAAKPGGIILAALKCEEGLGNMRVPKLRLSGLPSFIWKPLIWLMSLLISRVSAPGVSPEERFSTYFMLKALLRNRMFIYAPAIADQVQGMLPGVQVFSDFKRALDSAAKLFPRARVIIFPHGGAIYPELPSNKS
jgi:nickel-dependent lactate racemase